VCAGVWVMRRTRPEVPRPFKTPWVPLVPILGILISLAMMLGLNGVTWVRLVVWLIIGMTIYFTYGVKNSRVRKAAN
ncbi:MAG TPA: amino acid permease C-terminal domain-containing protein, partial [Candidatus Solibacter sp.]|nr:amino acid permease C-terminal domain-containing protein [Candidatus Solibacter sp.]